MKKSGKELTTFNQYLESASFELHKNYLKVVGKPSEQEYMIAAKKLIQVGESIQWGLGDLCNNYELQYGSIKKLAQELGLHGGSLYNYRWVAFDYPISSRNENLSWNHHRKAINWKDRDYWLKKAEENGWSINDMEAARKKEMGIPSATFDEFRKAASHLLNTGNNLLEQYKQARPRFRQEFEELVEQMLHEVDGLKFEVDISSYRYPPKLVLTRKDFEPNEEFDN